MPELRQDIVTGRWVVVATDRAMRPLDFLKEVEIQPAPIHDDACPFCAGQEIMTPLELFAIRAAGTEPNTPGWRVRVVPNKFPAFEKGEPIKDSEPMSPRRPAVGSHEVIIHSPRHDLSLALMSTEEIALVLRVYRQRYHVNSADQEVRYVHIIVNQGPESGASLEHPHSQLFGVPLVPPLIQQELAGASWFHTKKEKCVFCSLLEMESRLGDRVVYQTEGFIALAPFASRFPFEVWVLPRKHEESFERVTDPELNELAVMLKEVLGRFHEGLQDPSYNAYLHTSPCDGTPYPFYHWHIELMPRLTTLGGFEFGTSMMINITTPEHVAAFLREQLRR